MNRIWTVALTAIAVSAPALLAAALLSRPYCWRQQNGSKSAGRSVVADMPVSIAQLGRGTASLIHSSTVGEKPGRPADDLLWAAICMVESGGDPNAYNPEEKAAGIGQIRPILVADINRILRVCHYSLSDRWSPQKSHEMWKIFIQNYERTGTDAEAARMWCSGPRGMSKACSLPYWIKVKAEMERMR